MTDLNSKPNHDFTPIPSESRKNSKEYRTWVRIRSRCNLPTNDAYHLYGGRGIRVCDRWMESFANFLEDMGRAPSRKHSIDRKDNNGNYEPGNCRWTTMRVQSNNTRRTLFLTIDGVTKCLTDWATEYNIPPMTIRGRLRVGKGHKESVTLPVKKYQYNKLESLKLKE
jgi:hypothetical protein